jgi:Flp pilus assembly protein TadG
MRLKLRDQDGAAAVEFALIVGVLALLLFGMLQFGLAFFQLQNLRAATREGARVGSVSGTVADIQNEVESRSGVSGLAGSVVVESRTGGTYATVSTSTSKPCVPTTGTPPDAVRAEITLGNTPQTLTDIFTVDIPLMPTISLLNAQVYGEFRCER